MTGREHLQLYARVRGIPEQQIAPLVAHYLRVLALVIPPVRSLSLR